MTTKQDDTIGAMFGLVAGIPMMGSFIAGSLTVAWQAVQWLKTAEWPDLTLRDAVSWWHGRPFDGDWTTGMLGLDRILSWCLDGSPLALWLLLLLPAAWCGLWIWVFNLLFPNADRW
jgi:hypothetical protein